MTKSRAARLHLVPFQTLFVRRMSAGGPLICLECPEAVFEFLHTNSGLDLGCDQSRFCGKMSEDQGYLHSGISS